MEEGGVKKQERERERECTRERREGRREGGSRKWVKVRGERVNEGDLYHTREVLECVTPRRVSDTGSLDTRMEV